VIGEFTIIHIKGIGTLRVGCDESFLFRKHMNFLRGGSIGRVLAYGIRGGDGKGHAILILFYHNLTAPKPQAKYYQNHEEL
jgi:hypothetical protein